MLKYIFPPALALLIVALAWLFWPLAILATLSALAHLGDEAMISNARRYSRQRRQEGN